MIIHGQELSDEFLDEMWTAMLNKVPFDKWILVTKNKELVFASLKHFIDLKCYGEKFTITIIEEPLSFIKHEHVQKKKNKTEDVDKKDISPDND